MKSGTPSSSNPPKPRWDYDVYLSFRGEDTSKNFTDHLYSALRQAGIRTFRDDDKLPRGKTIFTDLFNAIRGSRISIVVFSKGYASSRWCLEELVEIVHCRNTIGQTLLPIFYHVDPSDIRKKTGTFEEAFARHEEGFQTDMERVQRWRVALTEAATASGWILVDDANGSEGIRVLVKEVSDEVCARLNSLRHPIRMFSFDDVDHKIQQQHELVGNSKCFGLGSRVIATSRDEQLRTELEAHEKYKVEDLHYCKSLQLSSSHASMMAHPEEDFLDEKGIDHYLQLTNKGHDYKFKFKYPKLFSGLTILDLDLDLRGVKSLHKLSRSIGMMSLVELMGLKRLHLSRTGSWSLPEALPLVDLSKISWSLPEALPLVDLSKMTGIRSSQKSLSSLAVLNDLNLSMTGSKSWPESLYSFEALTVLNLSRTGIRSLPESIVRLVNLKSLILRYCHRFMRLSPKVGELKQLQVLDLKGTEIMDLPENPRCPMLLALFLHKNHKLRTIPPSFFDYMPALEILNLSRTGIRSLPESVVRLVSLKSLFLSYCHRFMRLSPKVGDLKQLQVLDLEGTEIMDLPEEINKLTNLTCLKFSCYGYMDDGSSVMQSDALVPCGLISALSHLKELMISVNPDDKWWNECVEDIVTEVCTLQSLKTLVFYFPKVELVRHFISSSPMWVDPSSSKFRLIVGHHVKRIMSRLPCNVEFELKRWERCLKYINGVAVPREIKKVLQYSTAFFLERHATVKKLSDFGIGNMKQLKCCVVGECNEVEVIMNEADVHEKDSEADAHEEDDEVDACEEDDSNEIVSKTSGAKKIVLGSLEYLCIYYMKNLRNIWEGPVQPKCLSLLKFLTLRTCPQLTTIFTKGLLDNLYNLEELTVDDCPSIKTIVSCEISAEHKTSHFLPNLKRISLHYMPKLDTISSGLHIAPRLGWLSFYNCPNLKNLLIEEESSKDLKKIEGERSWWEALEWRSGRPAYLDDIFVPINIWDC